MNQRIIKALENCVNVLKVTIKNLQDEEEDESFGSAFDEDVLPEKEQEKNVASIVEEILQAKGFHSMQKKLNKLKKRKRKVYYVVDNDDDDDYDYDDDDDVLSSSDLDDDQGSAIDEDEEKEPPKKESPPLRTLPQRQRKPAVRFADEEFAEYDGKGEDLVESDKRHTSLQQDSLTLFRKYEDTTNPWYQKTFGYKLERQIVPACGREGSGQDMARFIYQNIRFLDLDRGNAEEEICSLCNTNKMCTYFGVCNGTPVSMGRFCAHLALAIKEFFNCLYDPQEPWEHVIEKWNDVLEAHQTKDRSK